MKCNVTILLLITICLGISCNKESDTLNAYRIMEGKWIATEIGTVSGSDITYISTQGAYLEFVYCESPPCTGTEYNLVLDSTISFTYEFNEEETELAITETGSLGLPFSANWSLDAFGVSEITLSGTSGNINYTINLLKED